MSRAEDYYTFGTFIDTEMCEDRKYVSRIDPPRTDISSLFRRLPWLFWFSLPSLHHLFLAPMPAADEHDICGRAIVSRPSDLRSTSIWEASERWEPSKMSLESHHRTWWWILAPSLMRTGMFMNSMWLIGRLLAGLYHIQAT
jgi:hypothetical protein